MAIVRNIMRNKWFLGVSAMVLLLSVTTLLGSILIINRYDKYVLSDQAAMRLHSMPVGIVLGAGVTKDGKPYRELQSRLDVAANALKAGYVKRLIVSGDNRFPGYDEPSAMKRYLVERHSIAADRIQPDFAGRSTYESCERAAKVFRLDKAIIYSSGSHLPRAIYLCRQFGVETYGVAATSEADNATRREAMARVKALFNVYINGENTVLGAPIPIAKN